MITLQAASSPAWLSAVLADFDAFLLDHAAAERKASALALSLITHYPDRRELVATMMDLAREELEHFYQVYLRVEERGLILGSDSKDPYIGALRAEIRDGRDDYFLDRLLVGGIVEARGCERFGMIAQALTDPSLRSFYREIAASEARHDALFVELAKTYFSRVSVDARLAALVDAEAKIIQGLTSRPALH
ncbi:MAG: tRNA-(ms[2]io[6]A)-hydroxylase [Deltaproteobacteria bacterium]|nr:tRNA-(ms[2]io[6]A)-hydroxylase [Deltaproteobacteria bacterium]MBW2362451.1 tRNA-(ms[2]io[6]A)-hydroxylase [Deltaproteobacteria bacterium]